MSAFFITGIDTEVGKTFATCALLKAAQKNGFRALGLKPVAAGADITEAGLRNEDATALISASNVVLPYETVNPVCSPDPISPHLSLRNQGLQLDVRRLVDLCGPGLSVQADLTLVEGAGGWRVPLNDHETLADFAKQLGLPVIMVVSMRLGCLNHAMLTAEAIERDGLNLCAWIANSLDPHMLAHEDNIRSLQARLSAPMLGHIPFCSTKNNIDASEFVDISKLMGASES